MADVHLPIEAGHVMMFARAIGDPNPIYFDEEYAHSTEIGHVLAPPTFTTAKAHYDPAYAMRPKPGEPWLGSGGTPSGIAPVPEKKQGTGLHAEQHYVYHRHPQPRDLLTVSTRPGETWEKRGRRAGKLVFRETITEFRDQDGDLVISARGVSVRTERPAEAK